MTGKSASPFPLILRHMISRYLILQFARQMNAVEAKIVNARIPPQHIERCDCLVRHPREAKRLC